MHVTSGRWRLGLLLASAAALMWATLPIALKLMLEEMDAYTITWYRLLGAALVLGVYLARRGGLPAYKGFVRGSWGLILTAALGLAGNYLLYLLGLNYVSPGTAQIVIQLAPIILLLGSLILFKEAFFRIQWMGLLVLGVGLLLFFNDKLDELTDLGANRTIGVALVLASAVTWGGYALAQKQLLINFTSVQILWTIYLVCSAILLPLSTPGQLFSLGISELILLAFLIANTLVAYGCFAESLEHWEASRVSALLSTTPLITIGIVSLLARLNPEMMSPEQLNGLSILGAALVVGGSIAIAVGKTGTTARISLPAD